MCADWLAQTEHIRLAVAGGSRFLWRRWRTSCCTRHNPEDNHDETDTWRKCWYPQTYSAQEPSVCRTVLPGQKQEFNNSTWYSILLSDDFINSLNIFVTVSWSQQQLSSWMTETLCRKKISCEHYEQLTSFFFLNLTSCSLQSVVAY